MWSEIEGLESRSMHGVRGEINLHGMISDAYADGETPSRGYVPTQVPTMVTPYPFFGQVFRPNLPRSPMDF